MKISRIIASTIIIALHWLSVSASTPRLEVNGGDAVSVGVYIAPIDSGAPIVEQNASLLLTPASILKSLTVASAWHILGPDFRWTTHVNAIGPIGDGTLRGNLVIVGSGDPTIGSRHFKSHPQFIQAVVNAIKDKGIRKIEGRIIMNQEAVPGGGPLPGWVLEDIPWEYGAGAYAINYCDNSFSLTIPSMTASPRIPGLEVINRTTSVGGPLDLQRGAGSNVLTVTGSMGKTRQTALTASMPDPALVLADRLAAALSAAGIKVENQHISNPSGCHALLCYKSPSLREIGRSLMLRSDNLMADATLRALAPGQPIDAAIKREIKLWRDLGVDLGYTKIFDGCGLTRANAIAPRTLGRVLTQMARADSTLSRSYVETFAHTGAEGTLKSFLAKSPRKNEFVLKSGSMGGVQCYAGYRVDPQTHRPTHVIVVMVNNLVGSRQALRQQIERLLLELET